MSLGGSNNAILFNNCQSLKNPIVTLVVNAPLITQGDTGFSLQLNCYPQTNPQATYQGYPMAWFQYVIQVVNSGVWAHIQLWSKQDPKDKGHGFSPSSNDVQFGSAPSNQVPRGSVMRIQLSTDSNDNVVGVTFGFTPYDFSLGSKYQFESFPTDLLGAIYGFQVNLVAAASQPPATFTSAGGILTYQAGNGLAVMQDINQCGLNFGLTGEQSNIVYHDVLAASTWNSSQRFGFGPNIQ